jgi:hypothetical protein
VGVVPGSIQNAANPARGRKASTSLNDFCGPWLRKPGTAPAFGALPATSPMSAVRTRQSRKAPFKTRAGWWRRRRACGTSMSNQYRIARRKPLSSRCNRSVDEDRHRMNALLAQPRLSRALDLARIQHASVPPRLKNLARRASDLEHD